MEVLTYEYSVNFDGDKTPKNATGATVNWERSTLYIDESNDRNITDEQVSMKRMVVGSTHFGCGWKDKETGQVWLFGCLDQKLMDELEARYQEIVNPSPR